jgi:hypothetical protein
MPQFNLSSSYYFKNRSIVNLYTGAGLGYMIASRNEIIGGQILAFDSEEIRTSNSLRTIYIPIMIGVSYRLNDITDIGLESSYFHTFSRYVDGIDLFRISDQNDRVFDFKLTLRIHLSIKKEKLIFL